MIERLKKHYRILRKNLRKAEFRRSGKGMYVTNSVRVLSNYSKKVCLPSLNKGTYEIRICHRDLNAVNRRKEYYIEIGYPSASTSKTTKHGKAFEYIGGGQQKNSKFEQSFTFKLEELEKESYLTIYNNSMYGFDIDNISLTQTGEKAAQEEKFLNLQKLEKKIESFKLNKSSTLFLYADLNMNVVDGSSVWLSSIASIIAKNFNVILFSKHNLTKDVITSNFLHTENIHIISPKDIGLENSELSYDDIIETAKLIDFNISNIVGFVCRGINANYAISKEKQFSLRLIPYLTDFYELSKDKLNIKEGAVKKINLILSNSKFALTQTDLIEEKLREISLVNNFDSFYLPPSIPDFEIDRKENKKATKKKKILYAGKVNPEWGIIELLNIAESEKSKNDVEVSVIAGKASAKSIRGEFDKDRLFSLNKNKNIKYQENLSRKEVVKEILNSDFTWCWRNKELEDNTLEISTKLLESIYLGVPSICYPSEVNKKALGEDYPYFIKEPTLESISKIINKKADIKKTISKIRKEYSLNNISNRLKEKIEPETKDAPNNKILFAGNDFKFCFPFISQLKSEGYQIKIDKWQWGKAKNLESSQEFLNNSEIIFCEWGLANAVWYSGNKKPNQKLYVRIHAQEVRKPAMKFMKALNKDAVDKFIFVSPHIRDKAIELYKIDEKKTVIIPNFVMTNQYILKDDIKPLKDRQINLGILGIIPSTKRLDRAVELTKLLAENGYNVKLFVKGHRPEDLEYMHAPNRVKELDSYFETYKIIDENPELKSRVIFEPWSDNIQNWYKKIDVILSPSEAESFHYALADGIASGCLPICWNWQGAEQVYGDSIQIVSDTSSAVQLFEEYTKLSKTNLLKKLKSNRKIIEERYSKDKIFENIKKVILRG